MIMTDFMETEAGSRVLRNKIQVQQVLLSMAGAMVFFLLFVSILLFVLFRNAVQAHSDLSIQYQEQVFFCQSSVSE